MRVIYLVQYFATPDQRPGVSYIGHTRAFEASRRLVARGHQVTVVTAQLNGGPRGAWSLEETHGVKVARVAVPYDQSMSYARRAQSFLEFAGRSMARAHRERADVILASSPPLTVAIPAMGAARARKPLVLEVRDLWPDMPIAMGLLPNRALRGPARALELTSYRRSRRIVVLSPGILNELIGRGFDAAKMDVITNAADLDIFAGPADPEAFYADVPLVRGRPFALFAGSMGPLHGLDWVVGLCAELQRIDPRPAIVIQGHGPLKDALIAEAHSRGVLNRSLFFAPQVPKVSIAHSYRACNLGLSVAVDAPGIENNGANKFFDSLAAGRGVAVNYGGWQGEVLSSTGAGVLLPRDVGIAARIMSEVLLDRQRCQQMGQSAKLLARERFSRDAIALQLEASLERAIG